MGAGLNVAESDFFPMDAGLGAGAAGLKVNEEDEEEEGGRGEDEDEDEEGETAAGVEEEGCEGIANRGGEGRRAAFAAEIVGLKVMACARGDFGLAGAPVESDAMSDDFLGPEAGAKVGAGAGAGAGAGTGADFSKLNESATGLKEGVFVLATEGREEGGVEGLNSKVEVATLTGAGGGATEEAEKGFLGADLLMGG